MSHSVNYITLKFRFSKTIVSKLRSLFLCQVIYNKNAFFPVDAEVRKLHTNVLIFVKEAEQEMAAKDALILQIQNALQEEKNKNRKMEEIISKFPVAVQIKEEVDADDVVN